MKTTIIAWAVLINFIVAAGEVAAQNAVTTHLPANSVDASPLQVSRNIDVHCDTIGSSALPEAAGLRCRLRLIQTVPQAATVAYDAPAPDMAATNTRKLDVTIEKKYLPETNRLRVFIAPAL